MKKKLLRTITTSFLISIVFCLSAASAQTIGPGGNPQPIELKLEHDALGKAATIPVQIGTKTYPFLLDTGSSITTITPDIAAEIGCQPFGSVSKMDAAGKRVDFPRCDGIELKMNGFATRVDAAVFNVMSLFTPETPQIGGIISLQTFEDRAITIDLSGNRLWLETENSLAERVKEMKPLETKIARQLGGKGLDILFAAATPKGKIWMFFDTGNLHWTHIAPHALEQLGVSLDAPNKAKTVKGVKFDFIGFGAMEIMARERGMIYDARFNYDTIARLVVTIDLRSGKAWAKVKPETPAK